jgi:hypothetical protein
MKIAALGIHFNIREQRRGDPSLILLHGWELVRRFVLDTSSAAVGAFQSE